MDLTLRERDVLALVAEGKRDRDIARSLDISRTTVRFHVERLFAKLDATNRMELVQHAREWGWISDRDVSRQATTP